MIAISSIYGASPKEPTLIKKLNTSFNKIKLWLVKLSLPVAGIAIASGVLMRKFSFGDEQKMITGKKVITNGIVGYAFILCIDMILKTVEMLVK
ncbi:MAG: pilin [Clostridia bacterium]